MMLNLQITSGSSSQTAQKFILFNCRHENVEKNLRRNFKEFNKQKKRYKFKFNLSWNLTEEFKDKPENIH